MQPRSVPYPNLPLLLASPVGRVAATVCGPVGSMKLLTHNMLACHIKGHTENLPFRIEATETQEVDADYDPSFLRHIFPRIEWPTLREAAQVLGAGGLPEAVEPAMLEDEDFLRAFHHALLEVQLLEGALVCPETGRRFLVSKGIPNLLLNEDEC